MHKEKQKYLPINNNNIDLILNQRASSHTLTPQS